MTAFHAVVTAFILQRPRVQDVEKIDQRGFRRHTSGV
jgi:hypothetical protein